MPSPGTSPTRRTVLRAAASGAAIVLAPRHVRTTSTGPTAAMRKIAADNALQKRFLVAGARCVSSTPEEALAYAAKERATWKDVVALSGAKAE